MSNVHKADRNQSKFEVLEQAVRLKKILRELSYVRNFGYKVRTEPTMPRNAAQWSKDSLEGYMKREKEKIEKAKLLDEKFLGHKRSVIEDDIDRMMHGIVSANSLRVPTCMAEADERRLNQERAIAACEEIIIDLQDIMDTVPIDKNWMTQVEPEIEKELALLRAWKKSDNEKRRKLRVQDMERWLRFISDEMKKSPDQQTVEMEILKGVYHAFLNATERIEPEHCHQCAQAESEPEE